ncbi:uncharacterized protein RCC_11211 [Ramularia collo-cygni]|uniref:Integrase zinc-binding domain-containing protein n=1 Tax=Ramularia collo-cygni TaxID=112498 RepID=A0A2D3VND2_9PEZI|nr:uncharacterized protein RCC_10543 [Ramularia collo-cygni]XP_023632202.1 uncharacterized protein RCC_11211 [Ramularia collo-cygni]CZT24815.1 uncharacterized protein RCC_10543 [Ramularia collo-cygni]CZT25479.1 uncharacterized protein RCC_11211 [Ramularia collo-cygni]
MCYAIKCEGLLPTRACGELSLPRRITAVLAATDLALRNILDLILGYAKVLVNADVDTSSMRDAAREKGEYEGYIIKDRTLFYGDALYIPKDYALRAQLMRIHYDNALAGHFRKAKTLELL